MVGGAIAPVLLAAGLARTPAATVSLLLNVELVATVVRAAVLFLEHIGRQVATGAGREAAPSGGGALSMMMTWTLPAVSRPCAAGACGYLDTASSRETRCCQPLLGRRSTPAARTSRQTLEGGARYGSQATAALEWCCYCTVQLTKEGTNDLARRRAATLGRRGTSSLCSSQSPIRVVLVPGS
jgi:hypothetical protein